MSTAGLFDLDSIAPFFQADSLAVIGASTEPRKQGGRPVRYSRLGGFRGKVYPINPGASEVQGMPAYPSLSAVDDPVECAFIALPAPAVEAAVRACISKGVRAAIIVSAGFAETGDRGRRYQDRIVALARASGMRLIGPNCMGAMDVARAFFPTFLPMWGDERHDAPKVGSISLISQSGAFGAHVYELARARGVGFAKWISTGNQCDVQVADCIAYFAHDPATRTIMVYLEGSPEPGKLIAALRLAREHRKPVILLKSGRSAIGAKAAMSHTGALVGSDDAFNGLCTQTGVHRAQTIDELLDIASACVAGKFPSRREVGLVTISGGIGALMADYAEQVGLAVPPLPQGTQEKLLKVFPYGAARNPVDPTALWARDVSVFGHSLRALLGDGGHEVVVLFASSVGTIPALRDAILTQVRAVRDQFPDRLIVVSMIGPAEVIAQWRSEGFPVYEDPRRALEVVAALAGFARLVAGKERLHPIPRAPRTPRIIPGEALNEFEAMRELECAGIPMTPRRLCASRAVAERAADSLGFPVVMKIVSPDIPHKSEMGGVALNLRTRREVGAAYESIMKRIKKGAPKARIDGVLLARQIAHGIETILGASIDPTLGPVVMFGIGGIFVEVYKDVAFRVAPFPVSEARAMIREIKGYRILAGARGRPPADLECLARAASRLSLFAAANAATLVSVDINPFMVLPRGEGAFGVDALIERVRR